MDLPKGSKNKYLFGRYQWRHFARLFYWGLGIVLYTAISATRLRILTKTKPRQYCSTCYDFPDSKIFTKSWYYLLTDMDFRLEIGDKCPAPSGLYSLQVPKLKIKIQPAIGLARSSNKLFTLLCVRLTLNNFGQPKWWIFHRHNCCLST